MAYRKDTGCCALHWASLVGVLSDTALILGPVEIYSKTNSDFQLYPPNTVVICHMLGELSCNSHQKSGTHKESIPKWHHCWCLLNHILLYSECCLKIAWSVWDSTVWYNTARNSARHGSWSLKCLEIAKSLASYAVPPISKTQQIKHIL